MVLLVYVHTSSQSRSGYVYQNQLLPLFLQLCKPGGKTGGEPTHFLLFVVKDHLGKSRNQLQVAHAFEAASFLREALVWCC